MNRGVCALERVARTASIDYCRRQTVRPFASFAAASVLILRLSSTSSSPVVVAAMSVSTATSALPRPPLQYQQSHKTFDLSALGIQIAKSEEGRQEAYETSRQMKTALIQAKAALESTEPSSSKAKEDLEHLFSSITGTGNVISDNNGGGDASNTDEIAVVKDRTRRQANLSDRVEEYVRYNSFIHFLNTAKLLPPSACSYATDEEYLAGACMGLASDLARYGLGRATERDVASVTMARDLVDDILNELLLFDFRNGPLRRKYDATKYSLKSLETLLYELSVTGGTVEDEPAWKKARGNNKEEGEGVSLLLPKDELQALRLRMEHRDELREKIIKKCRDGQKAAKQAIFALHRNDRDRAEQLMLQCETSITEELLPIVNEEPGLRYGSFANVMEEYAEAKLFHAWLFGKDGTAAVTVGTPSGEIMLPGDFSIHLEPEEYLGGICDLTGEVGRYAVQRGTARDASAVTLTSHTNKSILTALQTMETVPKNIGKKMDQLRRSVEKLERMLYEMSLSEATGGRNVNTGSTDQEEE